MYRFIFKKTSQIPKDGRFNTGAKRVESYIANYQDQAGKEKVNQRRGRSPSNEDPKSHINGIETDYWKNVGLPKGSLFAGGFFGAKHSPGEAQPQNQKTWIKKFSAQWTLLTLKKRKRKNNGIKLSLAPSKQTVADFTRHKIPPDLACQEILEDGLALYAKKHGWKIGDIGWLAGVHQDTDDFHMHVLLFPTTKQGQPLRASNQRGINKEDDLVDLTGAINIACEQYYRTYLSWDVQSPHVQLAWANKEDPPMPTLEDYQVANPLPQKFTSPQHKRDIELKRSQRRKAEQEAAKKVEGMVKAGNSTIKELQSPLGIRRGTGSIQKLMDQWVYTQLNKKQEESFTGEKEDIDPESDDAEKAQRAIDLLTAYMPSGATHLNKIEKSLEAAASALEEKRTAEKQEGSILHRLWLQIFESWNKRKLGQLRWRVQKITSALKVPSLRARIIINLEATQWEETSKAQFSTKAGLSELESFCQAQNKEYQQEVIYIQHGKRTIEERGQALLAWFQATAKATKRAKYETQIIAAIRSILSKTESQPEVLESSALLVRGGNLRHRFIALQKEMRRSSTKNKLPAIIPQKEKPEPTEPEEGRRSKPAKPEPLRVPKFLDLTKVHPLFEHEKELIDERRRKKRPEFSGGILLPPPKEEEPERSHWEKVAEKGLLGAILLEMDRRKGKDRGR